MSDALNEAKGPFWKAGEPGTDWSFGYRAAAVCRRGHVIESALMERLADPGMCSTCGASIVVECSNCGLRVRGKYHGAYGVRASGVELAPFCDGCGLPHPWATRQDRIYGLENILDQQDVDEADALWVRERLERLRQSDVSEDDQKKLWTGIKERAPGLFAGTGKAVISAVATAAVRKALGL